MTTWPRQTIQQLLDSGVLVGHKDGNHGERHPKSSDYTLDGTPFVMASDIADGRIDLVRCKRIPRSVAASLSVGHGRAGDVLLSHKATLGRVALVPEDVAEIVLTPQVTYFRVGRRDVLDPRFLALALRSPDFRSQLFAGAEQSTRLFVSIRDQRRLSLVVPTIDEQRDIVDVLGSIEDKIQLNRRMSETLEEMARAIFKSWFIDFDPVRAKPEGRQPAGMDAETAALFPAEFEEGLPKGWTQSTVGTEFRVTMGQSPPGSTYNIHGDGLPFFQGSTDFKFRFPVNRVYCTAPTRFAEKGDTLLSVRAPVGDSNIAMEGCAIGRGVAALKHRSGSTSYTFHSLAGLREHFERFDAEGTVFGAINKEALLALPSLSVPASVVAKFDEHCDPLDKLIENNERESRTLAELRDTLLPKLMSGELRVRDAEKIAEKVL